MTRIVKPQHFSSWLSPPQICVCFSHRLLCESEAGNSLDCALSFQLFHYPTHKLNNDALCFFCVFFTFILSHTHEPLSSASVFLPGIKRPAGGWKMWVIFYFILYILFIFIYFTTGLQNPIIVIINIYSNAKIMPHIALLLIFLEG